MRYIATTQQLEKDDGTLIKKFDCPLDKKWDELMPWSSSWDDKREHNNKRLCGSCEKCVIDFNAFSEEQIIGIVSIDPDACGYLRYDHPDLRGVAGEDPKRAYGSTDSSSCIDVGISRHGVRVIHTARSICAVQDGVARGYFPFFISNASSGGVWQKQAVLFDRKSRTLFVEGDYRSFIPFDQKRMDEDYGQGSGIALRMDFDKHSSPIAAYMIPDDISVGEKVFVEDVIEDYVGSSWNQGDTQRLKSCQATWDGHKLVLQVPSRSDVISIVG